MYCDYIPLAQIWREINVSTLQDRNFGEKLLFFNIGHF